MEGMGKPANWVEQCECPAGFEGQFCERCIIGYYHEDNGGPFARCVIQTFIDLKSSQICWSVINSSSIYIESHPPGVFPASAMVIQTTVTLRMECANASTTLEGTNATSAPKAILEMPSLGT